MYSNLASNLQPSAQQFYGSTVRFLHVFESSFESSARTFFSFRFNGALSTCTCVHVFEYSNLVSNLQPNNSSSVLGSRTCQLQNHSWDICISFYRIFDQGPLPIAVAVTFRFMTITAGASVPNSYLDPMLDSLKTNPLAVHCNAVTRCILSHLKS